MSHQLFKLPRQLNYNGNLTTTPGGKAYFYQSGTTTPQDVYQDSDLTVPHANPVVADFLGLLPAIYMNPGLRYKLTLRTSADVDLYTVDPVNDQIPPTYTRTAAEIAAGITPVDYAHPFGDVRRYGAVQGTSNSTTAFTTAQTAVGSGGTVTVVGTYRVRQVDLLSNRRWDLRAGIIESQDPETYMFRANATTDIEIIGGLLDGRRGSATIAGSNEFGLFLRGASSIRLRGVRLKDFYEDGIYIGGDNSNNACADIYLDVEVENSGRNNISVVHADGVRGQAILHGAQDSTAHYVGPWAGIDLEPDNNQVVDNIDLDLYTYDNDGNGITIYGLAGLTTGKSRISIRHVSEGDNRGLRFGRWPDRSAGNELILRYDAVIRDAQANESLYIDTIGGAVSADIKAQVYVNDNTKFVMTLLKESPGGTYANTPRLRVDLRAAGTVDNLFSGSNISQAMTLDTRILIDASALAFSAIGGSTAYCGHLFVRTEGTNPAVRDNTASTTVTATNVAMGERIQTNTGAAGDVTLTLQTSIVEGQEAEFYVADAVGSIRVALQDTAKVIYPFGGYRISGQTIGSRIRLRKLASGDWQMIDSPRGNAGVWSLFGATTFNPSSLADGAGETTTVTVPGAALGNRAQASFAADLQGITLSAYVSAADTVSVRFQNESGGTVDLASATLRCYAFK